MDIVTIYTGIIIIGIILFFILRSPYKYPYFVHYFDVSGKRKPQTEDLVDKFLNEGNFYLIEQHNEKVQNWKEYCQKKLEKSVLKNFRTKQYHNILNDDNAFQFILTRQQTRYRQKNYIKTSYKVDTVDSQFSCSYLYLNNRYEQLKEINSECTLREYHSKNQRKLMTKELRKKIMIRDNYTCQLCGKYMPDEVGLHIDHIIPISKDGKTVISNLQVLCSKCNGHKSDML